jgi:23S rRNA C2498 (ribose-2'-O)-methylase RlmM
LNVLTDLSDELEHCRLIVEHSLIVVVHLLQEINASHVFLNVMDHLGNVPLHQGFDLIEVFDHRDNKIVRKMQKFKGQLRLW